MEASEIYKCMTDLQRLRILNLLEAGALCVCHLQEILDETQVKISKQLAYMKQFGLIQSKREGNWMIYSLETPIPPLLLANLKHLRDADCAECNTLQADLKAQAQIVAAIAQGQASPLQKELCCPPQKGIFRQPGKSKKHHENRSQSTNTVSDSILETRLL